MINYINVINDNELDLEASYAADSGIVTITQFGLIYQEGSDDEEPAEVSIHIEDYRYFLEAITSCQEKYIELEFFTDDINFKVVYSPLDGDMWEVTIDGQFLVFEPQHIDELSRFLTADGRVEGCW